MNIKKENNELVLRLPLKQKISNPYMDEKDLYDTDNLIGIIAGEEFHISQLIDLNYKDDQQEGMPIIMFTSKEELEEACKTCGIDVRELPVCVYCKKTARGVHTWGDKGAMCDECEDKQDSN